MLLSVTREGVNFCWLGQKEFKKIRYADADLAGWRCVGSLVALDGDKSLLYQSREWLVGWY